MLKGKSLLDYTNIFSPNGYEKYDRTILKYFHYLERLRQKKYIVLFVVRIENLKIPKYHTFSKKTLVLSIICSKCGSKDKEIFKEEESIEILQILGLIENI